jgi:hypothetical protein
MCVEPNTRGAHTSSVQPTPSAAVIVWSNAKDRRVTRTSIPSASVDRLAPQVE